MSLEELLQQNTKHWTDQAKLPDQGEMWGHHLEPHLLPSVCLCGKMKR
jgi:hypothetical protein